jgi:hypothetical protein
LLIPGISLLYGTEIIALCIKGWDKEAKKGKHEKRALF